MGAVQGFVEGVLGVKWESSADSRAVECDAVVADVAAAEEAVVGPP